MHKICLLLSRISRFTATSFQNRKNAKSSTSRHGRGRSTVNGAILARGTPTGRSGRGRPKGVGWCESAVGHLQPLMLAGPRTAVARTADTQQVSEQPMLSLEGHGNSGYTVAKDPAMSTSKSGIKRGQHQNTSFQRI